MLTRWFDHPWMLALMAALPALAALALAARWRRRRRLARLRPPAALAALRDFADAVAARGGHRLGLVAFAGRAQLVCPLTVDYDHFGAKLGDLDADQLPAVLRPPPGAVSGTRLGAGLRRAVETLDPRY